MLNKTQQISKYILYEILGNVVYGLVLYYVFTWLAGYSFIYAYLWNVALIILGLAIDEYAKKMFQSKKLIMSDAENIKTSLLVPTTNFPAVAISKHMKWPKLTWGTQSIRGENKWPHPLI